MTHSKSILELKRKSLAMGLCGDYKGRWDNATTNKDLVNIVSDINGADFLCASVAKGWGLCKEFMLDNIPEYINGKYIARHGGRNGYTSEIYVGHKGDITVRTTILIVLYSDVTIHVPINHVCRIFSAKNTFVRVKCNGICDFVDYSDIYLHFFVDERTGRFTFTDPNKDPNSWLNFNDK